MGALDAGNLVHQKKSKKREAENLAVIVRDSHKQHEMPNGDFLLFIHVHSTYIFNLLISGCDACPGV